MANKIGIFNLSKMSAKTTTTAYLAAALSATNKKVVSVDFSGELGAFLHLRKGESKEVIFSGLKWEHLSLTSDFTDNLLKDISADYVLVDIPAYENAELSSILKELDKVIIPIEAEFYGLEGFGKCLNYINEVDGLLIEGILLTKVNGNSNFSNELRKELNNYFSNFIFETEIKRTYYLAKPTITLNNLSDSGFNLGFMDYLKLANEIIENER